MLRRIGWALALLTIFVGFAARAQEYVYGYDGRYANLQQTSALFKTAPAVVSRWHVTNWGAAVVVYLVDAASVPTAGGANVTVVSSWPLAVGTATAPTALDINYMPTAINLNNGFVVLCSSTGLVSNVPTYTAAATCTFDAVYH